MKICFTEVKRCPELVILLNLQDAITHRIISTPPREGEFCLQILQVPEIPGAWPHRHTASSCCGLGSTRCSVHKAPPVLGGGTRQGDCSRGWWSVGLRVTLQILSTCAWGILPTALPAAMPVPPGSLTPYSAEETTFPLPLHPSSSPLGMHSPDGTVRCLGFPLNKGEGY